MRKTYTYVMYQPKNNEIILVEVEGRANWVRTAKRKSDEYMVLGVL